MAKVLTSKEENYSQWYNDLVAKADLAENSAVRGCMVIKPYGYAIWEKMQAQLDKIDQDNRVPHYNSRAGNEADHRRRGKECVHQTMRRHNAD